MAVVFFLSAETMVIAVLDFSSFVILRLSGFVSVVLTSVFHKTRWKIGDG